MLQSVIYNIRGRAACWFTALSFLFYYSPVMAADPGFGVIPQIKLYYSISDDIQHITLRSVELQAPLTGQVVANCALNSEPSHKCIVRFSCVVGLSGSLDGAIISGYRLTDIQVYDAIMSLVGGDIEVMGAGNCSNPGVSLAINSTAWAGSGGAVSGYNWGANAILDPDPMQDPECVIRNGTGAINGPLEIGYGQILSTSAHGLEASTQLNMFCKKRAYMRLSVAGYNPDQGLSLLSNGSLSAKIFLNKFPAWPGASFSVEGGTTRSIAVSSTLQVKGTLAGGKFEGSTVIRLEYH